MNSEPPKQPRHGWLKFSDVLALVAVWGFIIYVIVSAFRSGWRLTAWLSDIADIGWPLAAFAGLLLLLAAHACKSTQKDLNEAYSFMRAAALSFLLGFFLLWLRWRHVL